MPYYYCTKAALARLFFHVTCTFKHLFFFSYLFFTFVAQVFASLFCSEDEYTDDFSNDEEEEEESMAVEEEQMEVKCSSVECIENNHLVADIINRGETLEFLSHTSHVHSHNDFCERVFLDPDKSFDSEKSGVSKNSYRTNREFEEKEEEDDAKVSEEDMLRRDYAPHNKYSTLNEGTPKSSRKNQTLFHEELSGQNREIQTEEMKETSNFIEEERFLVFAPPKSEAKRVQTIEKINGGDEEKDMFEDSCTVGSTSKSSSEWRSSLNWRDSGTEDPFSSSSRRSCPKWESYTVFQKYDEEMLFLDRITAQKLHETESLKSFQVEPRSISQRIVHKFATRNKKSSSEIYQNSYNELETAYVAQICLTWEALNWNYTNFQRKRVEPDPGCPAKIAQQFQQFQVLLQRYIETEPYERGRRPDIYARMRRLAPKLLQVPEYQDCEEDDREEDMNSRITSAAFLRILEDAIQTFMNFLKADRTTHCQILSDLFRVHRRGSVDPTLVHVMKKTNSKKKSKLKDVRRRARKCCGKSKLRREEEMEIEMGLIDLRVVSRVVRTTELTQEQLQWCEAKMAKVRVSQGKFQRDSSPLFFPSH